MFGKKKSALDELVKDRVILTMRHGLPMMSGILLDVLIGADGVTYKLADVKAVESGADGAGVFYIDKSEVGYIQKALSSAAD